MKNNEHAPEIGLLLATVFGIVTTALAVTHHTTLAAISLLIQFYGLYLIFAAPLRIK